MRAMANRLQVELVSGLKASLAESTEPPDAYAQSLELLRAFADEVRSSLSAGAKASLAGLTVDVERGHLVNDGVEQRVVIKPPLAASSYVPLRPYPPTARPPINLNPSGHEDH